LFPASPMPMFCQPLMGLRKELSAALQARETDHGEASVPGFAAHVLEAKKLKGLWPFRAPIPVRGCSKAPEGEQPGFVLGQFQIESSEPFSQSPLIAVRIFAVLEASRGGRARRCWGSKCFAAASGTNRVGSAPLHQDATHPHSGDRGLTAGNDQQDASILKQRRTSDAIDRCQYATGPALRARWISLTGSSIGNRIVLAGTNIDVPANANGPVVE